MGDIWDTPAVHLPFSAPGAEWQSTDPERHEKQPLPGFREYAEPRLNPSDKSYIKSSKVTAYTDKVLHRPPHTAPYGRDYGGHGLPLYGPSTFEDYKAGRWPAGGVDLDRAFHQEHPTLLAMGYEVADKLGSGGYGDVFRVVETATGRELAAKVLQMSRFVEKFEGVGKPRSLREVSQEMLRGVSHPHVMSVESVIHIRDRQSGVRSLFVVIFMDLMNGCLFDAMNPYMSQLRAKQWFLQIAGALRYLHDRRIAHLDIKPDNILYSEPMGQPAQRVYKLSDFGLAQVFGKYEPMMTADVRGAEFYKAPEVRHIKHRFARLAGRPDPMFDAVKCDVYSLGVSLAESLIGLENVRDYSQWRLRPGLYANRWVTHSLIDTAMFQETDLVIQLIRAMIATEPDARPTMAEVMQHRWVTG